ncbi:hypothetical protein Lalb_Chr04g0257061 [Lupinus albus]|uniref:Glutaredoxin domain-containing protein n=1 Tax=Lupinus albus TaxID=3870 RepID=A0A6A4QMP2_LUPAL|nr:hypothetical protein Lalb_Chr04g0257061 [Lupinus albus]
MDKVMRLASEKCVVILTKSSCCLCYAVNILFKEIGMVTTLRLPMNAAPYSDCN